LSQEKKLTVEEIVAKIETTFEETNDPDCPLVHPRVVTFLHFRAIHVWVLWQHHSDLFAGSVQALAELMEARLLG
jgi:hypothetical protein